MQLKKKGRPLNILKVMAAKQLKKGGFSYRQIAILLGTDASLVFGWVKRRVGKSVVHNSY